MGGWRRPWLFCNRIGPAPLENHGASDIKALPGMQSRRDPCSCVQMEAFAEALQRGQLDPSHYGLQADVSPLSTTMLAAAAGLLLCSFDFSRQPEHHGPQAGAVALSVCQARSV